MQQQFPRRHNAICWYEHIIHPTWMTAKGAGVFTIVPGDPEEDIVTSG